MTKRKNHDVYPSKSKNSGAELENSGFWLVSKIKENQALRVNSRIWKNSE
jgi:hypothetical protein